MGGKIYYNEIDPYAAQWLRNLIAAGHIPDGDVDERSITDVQPMDLKDYTQCHFFAGIAGWSYALRLAEWPDDRPIWTGSCPCQPFSKVGRGEGTSSKKHLWPKFFDLIRALRPPIVMGEQVAASAGYDWFDGVASDLESQNYEARAVDISAAAVNAPHIRQRIYWRAVDNAISGRHRASEKEVLTRWFGPELSSVSLYDEYEYITDINGNKRRIKPGISPLVNGVSNRVGRLRAYGNAIVPPLAAEVIKCLI